MRYVRVGSPHRLKGRVTKIQREIMMFSGNTSHSKLVEGVLTKGNRWFWWYPDGMKMSGFVGDGSKGRLIEIKK